MLKLEPLREERFAIGLNPVTKKNSQKIITNPKTRRPMIIPSEKFREYEHDCAWFMPHCATISQPVNIRALFYMNSRRRVDLVNLEEALLDVLVRYNVIKDDNADIVRSMDGSRVLYDKEHPRTEVIITFLEEGEE